MKRWICVEGELSRWRENAIRIALNLWIAEESGGQLTEDQAQRAVKIMRWCGLSYMALLDNGRIAQRFARVEDLRSVLMNYHDKTATLRDLANRHGFAKEEVHRLAAEFPDKLKIIKKAAGQQGGRPSEVLTIAKPPRGGSEGFVGG